MPEIIHYIVTETRQVKVAAISPIEAANLAVEVFKSGKPGNHAISTEAFSARALGAIYLTELSVKKEA